MNTTDSTPSTHSRTVEAVVAGRPTRDGAGVKLTRVLTSEWQARLDPFLMFDHFASDDPRDYGAGFPDHPHRGFETITYMVAGRLLHRDSTGGEGLLQNGGVQWMTAGRGVIHSEMPQQVQGRMEGFQLWLNLPASQKMCVPAYRDLPSDTIPEAVPVPGVRMRVIAGRSGDVAGAVAEPPRATEPWLLDVAFEHDASFWQPLPVGHVAWAYVYREQAALGEGASARWVPTAHMAVLSPEGDGVQLQAPAGARVLLVAGRPLREPIAQYGPFVMNTQAELMQAVHDYQTGRLAIERPSSA